MTVYLKNRAGTINAVGEYNPDNKSLIVKKGSLVSEDIAYSEKFRGSKSIEQYRQRYVKQRVVTEDVGFKSPSTAANFVTGRSSNGMILWKTNEGKKIKEI